MMYSNKLAIAVKSNGKVLREFGDTVYVPFGTEYTLLVKNLNSVRAQVRVTIDGQSVTEGVSLVIHPNSELELQRSIKNGNMNQGNCFKFIERTSSVEQHRGIGVTDGLIRVEYEFEKPYVAPTYSPYWEKEMLCSSTRNIQFGDVLMKKCATHAVHSLTKGLTSNSIGMAQSACASTVSDYATKEVENDAGITVPGSVSDQKFLSVASFPVEDTKHVMIVKLLGETETGKPVIVPVTVKAKSKCTSCGHTNKASAKFCSECGTGLLIV